MANLQAEKQGKSRDVKVALCPEKPHVSLHLDVQVAGTMAVGLFKLLVAVLPHLPNGICKKIHWGLLKVA